jgi:hypothetical protein
MKIRLTIPMIAFALALVGMSVRAGIGAKSAGSAPVTSSVISRPPAPGTEALAPSCEPSLSGSSVSPPGAPNLEEVGRARTTRSAKSSELAANLPITLGECVSK